MPQNIKVTMNPPHATKPEVVDKVEWGKPNDIITWYFVVTNQKIKKVKIQFEEPRAVFFTNSVGKLQNWYDQDVVNGHSQIYGKVPVYGEQSPTPAKYTIYGLNAKAPSSPDTDPKHVITSLDPSVIIDEP